MWAAVKTYREDVSDWGSLIIVPPPFSFIMLTVDGSSFGDGLVPLTILPENLISANNPMS